MRSQFHHVIDIAPTVLDAAGFPQPAFVNGVQQSRCTASSMLYAFDDAKAPERHETQYFEMAGNRGIYHKGWTAVTRHARRGTRRRQACPRSTTTSGSSTTPTTTGPRPTTSRRSIPRSCASCSGCGSIEAGKYNVLPLDDRFASSASTRTSPGGRTGQGHRQILFGGMGRLTEHSVINIKNMSYAVTAEIEVPRMGPRGHHRAGRSLRRLEPLRQSGVAALSLQFLMGRRSRSTARTDTAGRHRVDVIRLRRRRAGGEATSGCSSTALRSAKDAWTRRSRWCSRRTRPAT